MQPDTNTSGASEHHGDCYLAAHTVKLRKREGGGFLVEVSRTVLGEFEGISKPCEIMVHHLDGHLVECSHIPSAATWDWGNGPVDVCQRHDEQLQAESRARVRVHDRS